MRVAAIQLNSQHDKDLNIKTAVDRVAVAASGGAKFVLLPEYVDYLGPKAGADEAAESEEGPAHAAFSEAARVNEIWLHCGSIRVKAPDGRAFNTSVIFGPDGSVLTRYKKIHLFDVDIPDGVTYRESETVAPGNELVTCDVGEWKAGLTICYDLRFPELYRGLTLAGADLLVVPAAFTFYTGRDHWEPLLRARAVESQSYVLAAGQVGTHLMTEGLPPEQTAVRCSSTHGARSWHVHRTPPISSSANSIAPEWRQSVQRCQVCTTGAPTLMRPPPLP